MYWLFINQIYFQIFLKDISVKDLDTMASMQRMKLICVLVVFGTQLLNLQFTYSDAASSRLEKRYLTV